MINLVRFLVFIFIIVLSLSLKASEASNWLKQEVDKILIAYQDPNLPDENRFLLIEQTINNNFPGKSIAINIAKNHVTSASFKKQKLNTSDDILDFDYPHFDSPELSIESKETSEKIKEFISNLPEILKTPFILREYEGKSYQEIANIIDCPVGTVRSRIFRAREAILDFIKEELSNE